MSLQFWRTKDFSDESLLDLISRTFGVTFTGVTEARTWLSNNGYFTSYPDIVNDGLVLNLDAQNLSSFRGEPTVNLLGNVGATNINNAIDIQHNSTKINLGNGKYKFTNDDTGETTIRIYCNLNDLTDGETYACSIYYRDLTGTLSMDWCDVHITETYEEQGGNDYRMYGTAYKSTYNSTYRFLDINLSTNGEVTLFNDQIEHKIYVTNYTPTTRTENTWYDLSGNVNNCDLSNILFDSDGMLYNGGQYIDIGIGASVNMVSSPISFCCWVKTNSPTGSLMFLSAGQTRGVGNSNARFYFGINSGHWTFGIQTSPWSSTSGPEVTNEWTHISCSMTGTYARFFVNGEYDTQKSYTSYILNDNINIGCHDFNYYWNGRIDALQIYNKTLSDNEVLQNFNTQKNRFGL